MKILVLFFLMVSTAFADNYSFKFGLGIVQKPTSEIKAGSLRQESNFLAMIQEAKEVGFWSDTGTSKGRKNAAYAQYQLGVRPESQNAYVKAFFGPALLSGTDSQLGGVFQFAQDFGIGFQDHGSFVGLNYSHKSSAGLFKPNKGRDFIQIETGVRF